MIVAPFDWDALPEATAPPQTMPPMTHPVPVPLPGGTWMLNWDRDVPTHYDGIAIGASVDGAAITMVFDGDPVAVILAAVGERLNLLALTEIELSLIARHLSHGPLAALSEATGRSVHAVGPVRARDPDSPVRAHFLLSGPGDARLRFALHGSEAACDTLISALPVDRERHDRKVAALPIDLALLGRDFPVPARDLHALQLGDALVLPAGWSSGLGLRAQIEGSDQAVTVRRVGDDLRARPGPFIRTTQKENEDATMSRTTIAPDRRIDARGTETAGSGMADVSLTPAASSQLDRRRSLTITVTLELDRKTITVGDLAALEAGGILPFDAAPGGAVRLIASGAPFAEGDLVRIDDRLGLRVSKIL